jgi:hypothetical protein
MKRTAWLAIGTGLLAALASPALASPLYDIEVFAVKVSPSGTVDLGASVSITCEWGTSLVSNSGGSGYKNGQGQIRDIVAGKTTVLSSTKLGAPSPSAAKGTPFSTTWTAKTSGQHTIECSVMYADDSQLYNAKESTLSNNKRSVTVNVALGQGGPWPPGPDSVERSCAASLGVEIEVDQSSLSGQQVSSIAPKRKGTLPLIASQPFVKQSVQCGYGAGQLSTSYMFPCKEAQNTGKPHSYYCKK